MQHDIGERLLRFSINVILVLRKLENSIENNVIKYQLIKSATSVGANYEESQAGSSKLDFINKVKILLKEMRETYYWLKITYKTLLSNKNEKDVLELLDESEQLKKILGAICKNASEKK
ncbi:MAG: four helix bundle protein [Bacteroidales bacterium]